MITTGPSLTGLRGTQVTGSIIYTLVSKEYSLFEYIPENNSLGGYYYREALGKHPANITEQK
jgi:hypothetical protein